MRSKPVAHTICVTLGLSFLICKMGIIQSLSHKVVLKIKGNKVSWVFAITWGRPVPRP